MTWFFSRCLFGNIYEMWVANISQQLSYLWLLHYQFSRLFFLCLHDPYLSEKVLLNSKKICNNICFRNILKIFLNTFLSKRHTFTLRYFVLISLWKGFYRNLSQLLIHRRGDIFSDKSLFQRWIKFDNFNENISNETIILIWIISDKSKFVSFRSFRKEYSSKILKLM